MSVIASSEFHVVFEWTAWYEVGKCNLSKKFCLKNMPGNFRIRGSYLPSPPDQVDGENTEGKPYEFSGTVIKDIPIPAKASIEIQVNDAKGESIKIEDWIKNYKFNNVCQSWNVREKFKVLCTINWFGYAFSPTNSTTVEQHYSDFMRPYLMTEDLSDFVIENNNKKLPVHKFVLGSQSPVFLRLFKSDPQKSQINISGVTTDVMRKALEFLYSGKLDEDMNLENLRLMVKFAEKYQIKTMKAACEPLVFNHIDVDNAVKIYELASDCNLTNLYSKAKTFIVENENIIISHEKFDEMYQKSPDMLYDLFSQALQSSDKIAP